MIVLMTGSFVRTKRQRISNGKVGRGPRISFQPGGGREGEGGCVRVCAGQLTYMLHLPTLYWCSSTVLYFYSVDSDGQHMQTTDTMKNKEMLPWKGISLMEKFGGVSRLPRLELYMIG